MTSRPGSCLPPGVIRISKQKMFLRCFPHKTLWLAGTIIVIICDDHNWDKGHLGALNLDNA